MDYKYIEQLIERYWQCQTSLEEEQILRAFFSQEQVPENLRRYAPLFAYSRAASQEQLPGDDFDSRILAMTEDRPAHVRARTVTMRSRLMPLFKAAAVVAIIVTIGNAARFSAGHDAAKDDINYAGYKDTYTDPAVAYDEMENALQLVSEGISSAAAADTASKAAPAAGADSTLKR